MSNMAGLPPSQLISRRPLVSGPGLLPLLGSPRAARKASTVLWIEAAVGPAAWKTAGATKLPPRSPCACAVWLIGNSVESRPRAAMIEFFADCVVFIGLLDVLFLFWFFRRVSFSCRFYLLKREASFEPATNRAVFF